MPARNVVKQFDVDSMYHVYNRGNDKRIIFHDERDYSVFLSFLKYALLSKSNHKAKDEVDTNLLSEAQQFNMRRLGLEGKLELVAFCLMPNHFHLLFFQYDKDAITSLMRSLATGYSMYYNKRYKRSGSLFQGVYKAAPVSSDSYWMHISRYIHLNPLDIGKSYTNYQQSSYRYYMNYKEADWLKPEKGLNGLSPAKYEKFLQDWLPYRKELSDLKPLLANSQEI